MTLNTPKPNAASSGGRELSVADMVLVATAEAANWTTEPVRYGTIVVHAWRAFPTQFCLDGHPEFPDASDIHKPLYRTLKDRAMIDSLGHKTFRLTDVGLNTAKSIVSDERRIAAWRRTITIDVCKDETTQSALQKLLDESALDVGIVAVRLLAAVLATRFPGKVRAQYLRDPTSGVAVVVGDTAFSVLIPASVESLRDWIKNKSRESRHALVVRDEVRPSAALILGAEQYPVATASYGIETFLGQMIDSMAAYDQPRIAEVMQAVVE